MIHTQVYLRKELYQRIQLKAGQDPKLAAQIVMVVVDAYGTRNMFGFDAVFGTNGYRLPTDPLAGRRAA